MLYKTRTFSRQMNNCPQSHSGDSILSWHSARFCAASPLRRSCQRTAVLADAFVKAVVAEAVVSIVGDIAADIVAGVVVRDTRVAVVAV
jgi:hypothetical protein